MLITEVIAPIASKLVPAVAKAVAKLAPSAGHVAQELATKTGLRFVPMPTKIFVNKQLTSIASPIVNYEGRAIVVLEVNGHRVPFYCSSGENAKLGVTPGKWYPIFGVGNGGWINKGSEKGIASYYGSSQLRTLAGKLDNGIGDIRGELGDMTKFGTAKADALAVINQGLNPVAKPTSIADPAFQANAMAVLKPFL
jgi:hypothetical protein